MAMVQGNLQGNHGAVSQLNVTPLIDVLLVLLIIFMVIAPTTPKGMQTLAPQPPAASSETSYPAAIVVQVLAKGAGAASYRINSTELAKAALEPKLAAIFATRQEKVMFVRGDAKLTFDQVAEVVDMGRRAGVQQVAMLTPGTDGAPSSGAPAQVGEADAGKSAPAPQAVRAAEDKQRR